jgi:hypothetical protein
VRSPVSHKFIETHFRILVIGNRKTAVNIISEGAITSV